jgi:ATP-dependent protease ClpP protease subunit
MPPTVYLSYYDAINEEKTKRLMEACAQLLHNDRPEELYILFSSPGGSIDAGITLYNFLRALPVRLVMHNIGSINSIANVVFLAADRRLAVPHSSFLFHGFTWTFAQPTPVPHVQLQEIVSRFQGDESKMIGIITERTRLTEAEMRAFILRGESKNPTFALEKGVIHEIAAAQVPPDALFVAANLP